MAQRSRTAVISSVHPSTHRRRLKKAVAFAQDEISSAGKLRKKALDMVSRARRKANKNPTLVEGPMGEAQVFLPEEGIVRHIERPKGVIGYRDEDFSAEARADADLDEQGYELTEIPSDEKFSSLLDATATTLTEGFQEPGPVAIELASPAYLEIADPDEAAVPVAVLAKKRGRLARILRRGDKEVVLSNSLYDDFETYKPAFSKERPKPSLGYRIRKWWNS